MVFSPCCRTDTSGGGWPLASWPAGTPATRGVGIGLPGRWLGSSSAGLDTGLLLVLAAAGSRAGFTPGSFMPGGGGAGAKCGAPEDEDDVCAEADEAAN